jgi:hypothetical protein
VPPPRSSLAPENACSLAPEERNLYSHQSKTLISPSGARMVPLCRSYGALDQWQTSRTMRATELPLEKTVGTTDFTDDTDEEEMLHWSELSPGG